MQNANHHRNNNNSHYKVSLSRISHRAPGSNAAKPVPGASFPVPIIVDSGTTLSLLPKGVVASLAAQFSGAKSDNKGGYTVPCEHQARDGSVVFAFGPGVSISVAYRDFIWRSGSNCFLGAWYTPDVGVYILGDTFLRGAYGELSWIIPVSLFLPFPFCLSRLFGNTCVHYQQRLTPQVHLPLTPMR